MFANILKTETKDLNRDDLMMVFGRYQAMCDYIKETEKANGGRGGYCELDVCKVILGLVTD